MQKKNYTVMVINPGSTHDEIAVFRGDEELFNESISYSLEELKPYEDKSVTAQYSYRKKFIKKAL
ncbi:MAG: butyrate kinase, partial [Vulcanimicrobiota bacterium]